MTALVIDKRLKRHTVFIKLKCTLFGLIYYPNEPFRMITAVSDAVTMITRDLQSSIDF